MPVYLRILAQVYIRFDGSGTERVPLIAIPHSLERSALAGPRQAVFGFGALEAEDNHSARKSPFLPICLLVIRFYKRRKGGYHT